MQSVVSALDESDAVVSSTGMLSRELFEHRAAMGGAHDRDFLTVGSMGHASSIALGIALNKPYRQVRPSGLLMAANNCPTFSLECAALMEP